MVAFILFLLASFFDQDVRLLGDTRFRVREAAYVRLSQYPLLTIPAIRLGLGSECMERAVRCERLLDRQPTFDGVAFWLFANGDCRCMAWWIEDYKRTEWWYSMVDRRIAKIQSPCFGVDIVASEKEFPWADQDTGTQWRWVRLVSWMRTAKAVFGR